MKNRFIMDLIKCRYHLARWETKTLEMELLQKVLNFFDRKQRERALDCVIRKSLGKREANVGDYYYERKREEECCDL